MKQENKYLAPAVKVMEATARKLLCSSFNNSAQTYIAGGSIDDKFD